jgi:hypothetical protein
LLAFAAGDGDGHGLSAVLLLQLLADELGSGCFEQPRRGVVDYLDGEGVATLVPVVEAIRKCLVQLPGRRALGQTVQRNSRSASIHPWST